MAVSVFKTFTAGEVLTASDLNSSLTQFTTNGEDFGWPATKAKDLDGQQLTLDGDADTLMISDNDDIVDWDIGGVVSAVQFTNLAAGPLTIVQIQDTVADAGVGPSFRLYRNSASPAAADVMGEILFDGEDSAGNQDTYGRMRALIDDATSTSEDGELEIATMQAGTLTAMLTMDTEFVVTATNFSVTSSGIDMMAFGNRIDLDTDNDTSIRANADDTIDFELGGADHFAFNAGGDLTMTDTDAGAGGGPELVLHRNSASPANGDALGRVDFDGEDSASNLTVYGTLFGEIKTVTSGSEDGRLVFQTIGSATQATRMTLELGLYMVGATGSDQGGGTINATGVFDDGVGPLTDYVLDYAATGEIDLALYDKLSIWSGPTIYDTRNEPARRFKANTDELDIDVYLSKALTARTLPSMPTVQERLRRKHALGELVQGLWEAAEVATVQRGYLHEDIKLLSERVAQLEAA